MIIMNLKILAAAMTAAVFVTFCGCGANSDTADSTAANTTALITSKAVTTVSKTEFISGEVSETELITEASSESQNTDESKTTENPETEPQSSEVKLSREEIVDSILSESGADEYAEYDIDGDGNPELIANIGENEAERHCEVYMIGENGGSLAGTFSSGNTSLYTSDDGLTIFYAHMGGYTFTTARLIDGSLILTDEGGGRTEEDYPEPDGERIGFLSVD